MRGVLNKKRGERLYTRKNIITRICVYRTKKSEIRQNSTQYKLIDFISNTQLFEKDI